MSTLHFRKVAFKIHSIHFSFWYLQESLVSSFKSSFENHINNERKIKYFTLPKTKSYLLFWFQYICNTSDCKNIRSFLFSGWDELVNGDQIRENKIMLSLYKTITEPSHFTSITNLKDSKKNDKTGHIHRCHFLRYTCKQFVHSKSKCTQSDFCLVTFQSDCNNLFCGVWSSQRKLKLTQCLSSKIIRTFVSTSQIFFKVVLFSCSYFTLP